MAGIHSEIEIQFLFFKLKSPGVKDIETIKVQGSEVQWLNEIKMFGFNNGVNIYE